MGKPRALAGCGIGAWRGSNPEGFSSWPAGPWLGDDILLRPDFLDGVFKHEEAFDPAFAEPCQELVDSSCQAVKLSNDRSANPLKKNGVWG
jgi:hypothetical protein